MTHSALEAARAKFRPGTRWQTTHSGAVEVTGLDDGCGGGVCYRRLDGCGNGRATIGAANRWTPIPADDTDTCVRCNAEVPRLSCHSVNRDGPYCKACHDALTVEPSRRCNYGPLSDRCGALATGLEETDYGPLDVCDYHSDVIRANRRGRAAAKRQAQSAPKEPVAHCDNCNDFHDAPECGKVAIKDLPPAYPDLIRVADYPEASGYCCVGTKDGEREPDGRRAHDGAYVDATYVHESYRSGREHWGGRAYCDDCAAKRVAPVESPMAAPATDWRTAALVAPAGACPVAWVRAVTSICEDRRGEHARAHADALREAVDGWHARGTSGPVNDAVYWALEVYCAAVSPPSPAFVRRGARVCCDNEHPEE